MMSLLLLSLLETNLEPIKAGGVDNRRELVLHRNLYTHQTFTLHSSLSANTIVVHSDWKAAYSTAAGSP